MKFDLEKAKAGHPVQIIDGMEARIICFDKEGDNPIVVLRKSLPPRTVEYVELYTNDGRIDFLSTGPGPCDLVMKTVVKTKWVLIYKDGRRYETKREAIDARIESEEVGLIAVPVEMEELECAVKNL